MTASPDRHHLQIRAPHGIGATAEVLIDGQPTRALTGLTLTIDADKLVAAELRILASITEFDGTAELTLPEETRAQLIALGWTPPA